jgi:hypothetical protein
MEVSHGIEGAFMAISTALAAGGIVLAYLFYGKGYREPAHKFAFQFPGFVRLVRDKFRIDELYAALFIRPLRWLAQQLFVFVDRILIDKVLVEGMGALVDRLGRVTRWFQSGDAQRYMAVFALGAAFLVHFATQPPVPDDLKVNVSGLTVDVDARRSGRPSPRELQYAYDFDDGRTEVRTAPDAHHAYRQPGRYTISVTVTDPRWGTSTKIKHKVQVQ